MTEQAEGIPGIGPVYSLEGVARWLGLPVDDVTDLVDRRELLAFRFSDGPLGFPALQFGPAGELLPGLADVCRILDPEGDSPLTVALALGNPSEVFGGLTGAEMLRAGETQTVFDAVERAARALRS